MTKEEAITEVQRLIREHGLTLKDYQAHPRKGVKLPPKVIGPNGETWAGRGMKPKWLTDQMRDEIAQFHQRKEAA